MLRHFRVDMVRKLPLLKAVWIGVIYFPKGFSNSEFHMWQLCKGYVRPSDAPKTAMGAKQLGWARGPSAAARTS